jgi:hypothetical protein
MPDGGGLRRMLYRIDLFLFHCRFSAFFPPVEASAGIRSAAGLNVKEILQGTVNHKTAA